MASSPPLLATAPAGGRAPSPSRPSLAEPPPGQPAAPESAARMWAVGQPSGPCGAGRPAWEPGSSPRVAASSPGRDVTGQLCLDRSQGRVGGTGASPQCPCFQGRRHDTTWPTVHEKVLCVSLPDTASGVEGSASSGGLALASARDKTDRRVGPRPLAPGAIWPSCSWLSSAQPCVAQSLAPAPFSARRGEGGVTPGRAPPPPLGGSPCSVCVVNAGTGRRPPFRPRGQSSRFVTGGHCGAGRGFPEACVVSRASFSSC